MFGFLNEEFGLEIHLIRFQMMLFFSCHWLDTTRGCKFVLGYFQKIRSILLKKLNG